MPRAEAHLEPPDGMRRERQLSLLITSPHAESVHSQPHRYDRRAGVASTRSAEPGVPEAPGGAGALPRDRLATHQVSDGRRA